MPPEDMVILPSCTETECVWGTCVDLSPGYLYVCSSLAEVDSIKAAKRQLHVNKREFLRLLTSYCFTNTHGKVVVVRQNVCGVPVCVDLSPEYLYVCSSLAEVESMKAAKRRLCVYKRAFLHLLMCNCSQIRMGR